MLPWSDCQTRKIPRKRQRYQTNHLPVVNHHVSGSWLEFASALCFKEAEGRPGWGEAAPSEFWGRLAEVGYMSEGYSSGPLGVFINPLLNSGFSSSVSAEFGHALSYMATSEQAALRRVAENSLFHQQAPVRDLKACLIAVFSRKAIRLPCGCRMLFQVCPVFTRKTVAIHASQLVGSELDPDELNTVTIGLLELYHLSTTPSYDATMSSRHREGSSQSSRSKISM